MDTIGKRLNRYLETETLLNRFFSLFDYCLSHCVKPELEKNADQSFAACCKNKYYTVCDLENPAYDLLREEREMRFGKPENYTWENPVSPCEYHNPSAGCVLTTHKSPICLAFFCRKGIDHLRARFGIYTYDYLGFYYALEWILTGDLPEGQYIDFIKSIEEMIERIERACR